jgi:hypothetical protein
MQQDVSKLSDGIDITNGAGNTLVCRVRYVRASRNFVLMTTNSGFLGSFTVLYVCRCLAFLYEQINHQRVKRRIPRYYNCCYASRNAGTRVLRALLEGFCSVLLNVGVESSRVESSSSSLSVVDDD